MDNTPRGPRIAFLFAAYGAWVGAWVLAAGLGVVFYLVLTGLYWWLGLGPRPFRLFAILLVLALGVGWFAAAAWTEQWLVQARDPATLRRRAARLFGGGSLLLALGYLAAMLLPAAA